MCGTAGRQIPELGAVAGARATLGFKELARRESLRRPCGSPSRRVRRLAGVLIDLYGACNELVEIRARGCSVVPVAEITSSGRSAPCPASPCRAEETHADLHGRTGTSTGAQLTRPRARPRSAPRAAGAVGVVRPGGRHVFPVPVDPPSRRPAPAKACQGRVPRSRWGSLARSVTRRADMLDHTDFGRDLPYVVAGGGFDVDRR